MKTQVTNLIRDVMTALREVDPNEAAFIGDKDNADLETMIESKIEETVDEVHQYAVMNELAFDATIDICYNGNGNEHGFLFKPSSGILTVMLKSQDEGFEDYALGIDILRMISARSKSWPFDVHNTVFPDDPLYEIVTDKYVGAQSDFPAVTQRNKRIKINGQRVLMTTLELRCLNKETDWAHITLIPQAKIENGMVDIDSRRYRKVVNEIALKMKNWNAP